MLKLISKGNHEIGELKRVPENATGEDVCIMMKRLWTDQAGAVISADIILVATTLVIGVMVGLKSVRDAVVTELADVAQAVANGEQSYSFSGVSGHLAASAGAYFIDTLDYCDSSVFDPDLNPNLINDSKCVNVGDVSSVLNLTDENGDPVAPFEGTGN